MPNTEKITITRDGDNTGAHATSSNPLPVSIVDGLVTIKWGDAAYSVSADSEWVLATKYKFTMASHLVGLFIPNPNLSSEALIARPAIIKNGGSLIPTVINYSASSAFNIGVNEVLGHMIFVDGKTVMTT